MRGERRKGSELFYDCQLNGSVYIPWEVVPTSIVELGANAHRGDARVGVASAAAAGVQSPPLPHKLSLSVFFLRWFRCWSSGRCCSR